jgi:hypothetical protein
MMMFNCARVGLTATLYRSSDGFEKVIPLMFGPAAAVTRRPFTPSVVRIRWTRVAPLRWGKLKAICTQLNKGSPPSSRQIKSSRWMHSITHLNTQRRRNADIMDEILRCLGRVRQHQPTGRVLVLFDRWHQAIKMCETVGRVSKRLVRLANAQQNAWENAEDDAQYTPEVMFPEGWTPSPEWRGVRSGVFVGKQKQSEQSWTASNADVVFSTMSMAYIGLDLTEIAGMVIVSLSKLMEQATGRSQRMVCMPKCAHFSLIGAIDDGSIHFEAQLRAQLDYMVTRERWPLVLHDDTSADGKVPRRPLLPHEASKSLARLRANAMKWFEDTCCASKRRKTN